MISMEFLCIFLRVQGPFFYERGGPVGFGGGHSKKISLKGGGPAEKKEGKGGGGTKKLD